MTLWNTYLRLSFQILSLGKSPGIAAADHPSVGECDSIALLPSSLSKHGRGRLSRCGIARIHCCLSVFPQHGRSRLSWRGEVRARCLHLLLLANAFAFIHPEAHYFAPNHEVSWGVQAAFREVMKGLCISRGGPPLRITSL